MEWDSYSFYQLNQEEAWTDLSQALKERLLTLMVGAGISTNLKLPEWHELARRVAEAASNQLGLKGSERFPVDDLVDGVSGRTLLQRMLRVRKRLGSEAIFVNLVKAELYDATWKAPKITDATETLRALGMMVAGSQRGRINEIVNYNFDSILEWYLLSHGFVVATYPNWPSSYIEADVRIYHPHGYLPFSPEHGTQTSRIAFDEERLSDVAADPLNQWRHLYRYLFCTRVFLALGLSGEDPIINLMLQEAKALTDTESKDRNFKDDSNMRHEDDQFDRSPIGFWCQRKPSEDKVDEGVWADWKASLNSRAIVLLEYEEHDQLAERLARVVRDAAGGIQQAI